MDIFISKHMYDTWPNVSLGILEYDIEIAPTNQETQAVIDEVLSQLQNVDEITQIPTIRDTRDAYKACGKSPSKYRSAAEAMLRRIKQKKGLYKINNVIDIQNMMSVSSGYSIGSYDASQIEGDVILDVAKEGMSYQGIGKEDINISNLPVLFDDAGPFGNPSSDSIRAMIKEDTKKIVTVVYSFSEDDLADFLLQYQDILEEFTSAQNIELSIVDVLE